MTIDKDTAHLQAITQVQSIVAMVAALNCDYDRLEALLDDLEGACMDESESSDPNLRGWISDVVRNDAHAYHSTAIEFIELESAAGDCTSEEEAREAIQNDPLSVEVRSDWVSAGDEIQAEEFRIVLCTGGPHVEIVGVLDLGTPSRVRALYRDWGTSGELFDFDHDAVLTYCQQFYFGE